MRFCKDRADEIMQWNTRMNELMHTRILHLRLYANAQMRYCTACYFVRHALLDYIMAGCSGI